MAIFSNDVARIYQAFNNTGIVIKMVDDKIDKNAVELSDTEMQILLEVYTSFIKFNNEEIKKVNSNNT